MGPMETLPGKASAPSGTRRGLGRGLDALLPSLSPVVQGEPVRQIAVSMITPNPYQPRQQFHPDRLMELAESIRVHGIVQPVVVRREGDRYMLVAGERRWRACVLVGLDTVPAIVREIPQDKILELTLIENIQREDLNPIETAEAFARLSEESDLTHEQIAARTGKDRATVTNLLRLLKLPVEVRAQISSGAISMGHAKVLLGLASEEAQKSLADRIVAQGLSVRQAEELAKEDPDRLSTPRTIKEIQAAALQDPNVLAAVREMERSLGTRVRLVGDDLHGKIVIEYHSSDDLDRIFNLIVGRK